MSATRRKRPARFNCHWTAAEDALVGTKSDLAVARKLRRTVVAVMERRQAKGISLRKQWRPEDDKLLGARPDEQVAALLGCSRWQVSWRRRKLGIACFPSRRPWGPEQLDLLGKRPDAEVARLTGHSLLAVEAKRRILGRRKADAVRDNWTAEQDRLLGTMPDGVLAERIGRTRDAVRARRVRRGIGQCGALSLVDVVSADEDRARATDHQTEVCAISWPSDCRRTEPTFEVSENLRHLRLKELPLSVGVEGVLKRMGVERLGQLHGLPMSHVRFGANYGAERLAELEILLRRAEAGEFTRAPEAPEAEAPTELLRLIDDWVARLPEPNRVCLTLRLGAAGGAGRSLGQLSQQLGVTPSALGCRVAVGLRWMERQGRPRLPALLEAVERIGARTRTVLGPALVASWLDPQRPARYSPQFYSGIIARLIQRRRERERTLEVSAHLRHLSVKEMPLSVRLERVLKDLGVTKLGQLHGFPTRHLRYWPQCGSKTHAELEALLRRAEGGEFSRSRRLSVAQAEAELLRRIDELISELPEQARDFLALRFGGAGEAGQTYRQIGQAHGVTRSAVGRCISDAIHRMIRYGRPRLQVLLDSAKQVGVRRRAALDSQLVATWRDAVHPFQHSPQFYARLIPSLRDAAGQALAKGGRRSQSSAKDA